MSEWINDTLPDKGLAFANKPVRIINRSGGARLAGDLMQFDIGLTASGSVNFKEGDAGSGWVGVVDPIFAAAGGKGFQAYAPYVLLRENVGDGLEGLAWLWGTHLLARVDANGTSPGNPLALNANGNALRGDGLANTGSKILGRSLGTLAGAGTLKVLFNGFHFWGRYAA